MTLARCPSEIDWLDYLEDEAALSPEKTRALSEHLDACLSCQALVELIRSETLGLTLEAPTELAGQPDLRYRWRADPDATPVLGGLWLVRSGPPESDSDSAPVLLLSDPWQEEGKEWIDAAPFSTDIESASDLDLRLGQAENSLGQPVRILFPLRGVLSITHLRAQVGELNERGMGILERALDGALGPERYGTELAGPHDLRLAADLPIAELMAELRAPYLGQALAEQPASEAAPVGVAEHRLKRTLRDLVLIPTPQPAGVVGLAAARPRHIIGEEQVFEVKLDAQEARDPEKTAQQPRHARISVALGRDSIFVEQREGKPLRLRGTGEPIPVRERRRIPIVEEAERLDAVRRGEPLISELERIIEWAEPLS